MVKLTIEVSDRTYYSLKSMAFLREAEKLNEDPSAPTTVPWEMLQGDPEAELYDALMEASLGVGQGVLRPTR